MASKAPSTKALTNDSIENDRLSKNDQTPSTMDQSAPPVAAFDPLLERDKLHAHTCILAIQQGVSSDRRQDLTGAFKRRWQDYFKDKGSEAAKLTHEQQTRIDKALQARLEHPLIAVRALHFIARYVFPKDREDEREAQVALAQVSPPPQAQSPAATA
jgi:hypothetical protein